MDYELIPVGEYKESCNQQLGLSLPTGTVYQSTRLIKHVLERHPNMEEYMERIPDIIESPTYIGSNPKNPNSVELVQVRDNNILVAVKLDEKKDYLYVASIYDITPGKLDNRISSGRLKEFQISD